MQGWKQQLKLIRTDVESENYLQEIQGTKDRIDEVEQDALETGYAPIAKIPSATDVIKLMLDEESTYRLLSAVYPRAQLGVYGSRLHPRARRQSQPRRWRGICGYV